MRRTLLLALAVCLLASLAPVFGQMVPGGPDNPPKPPERPPLVIGTPGPTDTTKRPPATPGSGSGVSLGLKFTVGDRAVYKISLDGNYLLTLSDKPVTATGAIAPTPRGGTNGQPIEYSELRSISQVVKDRTQDGNLQVIGQYTGLTTYAEGRALNFGAADLPAISTVVNSRGMVVTSKQTGNSPFNAPIRPLNRDPVFDIPFGTANPAGPGATWSDDLPVYLLAGAVAPPKVKANYTLVSIDKEDGQDVAEVDFNAEQIVSAAVFPLPEEQKGLGKVKVAIRGSAWIRLSDGRLTEEQVTIQYEAKGRIGEPTDEMKDAKEKADKQEKRTNPGGGLPGGGRLPGGRLPGGGPGMEEGDPLAETPAEAYPNDPRPVFAAKGEESRAIKLMSATSKTAKAAVAKPVVKNKKAVPKKK